MKRHLILAPAFVSLMIVLPLFGQEENQEPIPIPIDATRSQSEEQDSRAVRSFSSAVAWSTRNRFGFSLGVSEGRLSNVFPNALESHPSMLTAFSGSAFANFGKRKSRLHLDYGAGYRIYNQQRNMDGADHYGNITYTYQASRKFKLGLSDMISSSLNDPFSSFAPSLRTTIDWSPSPSYAVVFMPQRLTQNVARAEIDVDLTRRAHIYGFGAHEIYKYGERSFTDSDAVQAGAGMDLRITDWMYLSSTYSGYLNQVDDRQRDVQIHRIEIGRFRFSLSRHTEMFFSGGVEIADDGYGFHTEGMYRAGISRSSEKNVIYANYQHTMTSALGYSRAISSDNVTVGLGQRFTPRTNLRLSGSYLRGADFFWPGLLNGYIAQVQFEYALTSNFFLSGNYAYQYQKNTIPLFADLPDFDRSVVFARLQFVWPSIRLKSE